MKKSRKNLKKGSGRTFLALALAAALTVGGITTAFATEEDPTTDVAVTEETVDAMPDEEGVSVSSEESVATTTNRKEEDADDAADDTLGADTSIDDANELVPASDTDYDPSYGLYGGYDGQDSMYDPEKAGACVGWDIVTMSAITSSSGLWWIDDYYVGENDSYYVEETNDFTLKYQVEFHASEDLGVEAVEILIEASLGTYRDGTNILPTELGIPYGYPDNYTESSASPFNYYYVDEDGRMLTESQAQTYAGTVYLKVWNYRDIVSGSNAMFQVLYKSMDIMQIYDESTWDLDVTATVDIPIYDEDGEPTGETREEKVDGNTLSGHVNTSATLSSVTKRAFHSAGVSYTPELYSKAQISKYISGSLSEPYDSNFDDYIYIVWQVSFNGTATQAYEITVDENTFSDISGDGSIVGYKVYTKSDWVSSSYGTDADGNPTLSFSSSTQRSFSATFYVVTAYDDETYVMDTEIENDVKVTVHPVDGYDEDTTKSASATTTWGEYEWHYAGDTIGVSKSGGGTFYAYLELYKQNAANGKDTGAFSFSTSSTCRGYSMTHYTTNESGNLGEYIPGSYYTVTTVDDVLYAYPNSGTTPSRMLTKDDYYFSSVTVKSSDTGYDVWEDTTSGADKGEGVDQNLYIYAMFYDADEAAMDEDGWEYVGMVEWTGSGSMTYTFSEEDLARQPYRVKAVHSSVNYSTSCTISLGVMLRADSDILNGFYDTYGEDLDSIKIENVSGVAGQLYDSTHDGTYFQDTSIENGNYSEKDTETGETLAEFTEDLYDTILQRDNAYATLYGLTTHAAATKNVSTENDMANGRVLANYTLTAYESYRVTGSSTVDALKELGISLPARNDVTYYDLLPYGMQFNANAAVTAGRITTMTGSWTTNAKAWDSTGVTVTVGAEDVITNWNGTGRTMVAFHIHYDGDDAGAYYNNLWFEGYGISFQAYYDWADMDEVDAEYNIAAYVAENVDEETQQLLGEENSSVWKDDGSVSLSSQYAPFMGYEDLNGDGITDLYTNMYCSTTTSTNVATANTDSIKKTVRADADAVAEYGTTAVVANGGTYTYEISLSNGTGAALSEIVIFDKLEYAVEDGRVGVEEGTNPSSIFNGLTGDQIEYHWTGTFISVTTTALADIGINAVVYYNADRNATVSGEDGSPTPTDILTADYGWYTEEDFISIYGSLSEAKAVAVDISTKTNGNPFTLEPGKSLSFQIHMQAPDGSDCSYAFNNPMYYSVTDAGEWTSATDSGDTVRVEIGDAGTLEVEKEFADADSVPGSMANQRFTFRITRNIERSDAGGETYTEVETLAGREYMVYNWDGEEWVSTGVISSTDAKGQFTLRAGQKAVFCSIVDVENVEITEVESVLWDAEEDINDDNIDAFERYVTYTNAYRSPVYLYKTVMTTDLATDEELADAAFTFRLLVDTDGDGIYEPYANGEYLYVKEVLTDGSSPSLDTGKGDAGHGYADENGCVTLGIDDIIVFFPCDENGNYINVPYQIIEETSGEKWNDDWVNMDDTAAGTTGVYGTSETITNYYKYRNLILTKDLSDYDHDPALCEDEWTFRLTDENEDPVIGNHWYMIDADGSPVYTDVGGEQVAVEGNLDSNGEFSFTGAGSGRRIVIEKLVEGEKYTLTETNYDAELYEQVNDGTVDTTMPTYGITRSVTITNKYLMKDLSVEKLVLTDTVTDEANSHEFTFTLKKLVDGVYVPVPGATYTVDGVEYTTGENGQFTLKHGEEACFDDLGYQGDEYRITETSDAIYGQIYPAENGANEVTLQSDGGTARFINGNFDQVASLTKELVGLDDVGAAYADIVKGDNQAETLVGEDGDVPYAIDVTFGVYDSDSCVTEADGDLISYVSNNGSYPYVYIKIEADGTCTLMSYNGGVMTETLNPYDYIYIAAIGDFAVKASEDEGMARVLLDVASDVSEVIGADQILSEGDVMSGSAAANEDIVLVNNISSANKQSEIYKLMTETSDEVPTGSHITFVVEIYDAASGTWSPASGIKYIAMDGYTGRSITVKPDGLESDHNYANYENKTWEYTLAGAEGGVYVTFDERTRVEELYDYIYIYDADDKEIGKYTGTMLAGATVYVPTPTFKIKLESDNSVVSWGFKVTRVSTKNPEDGHDGTATSGVLETGSDGKITLTKTDGGYPYIRFIEDEVYANVYEGMQDGTLRIVETSSGTDDVWGLLVGYDGEGWIGGPSLNIQYADTFYNGNDETMQFEVEKEMTDDTECDAGFTFYLRQILAAGVSPITSMDQILDYKVGAGVTYAIYDVETGVRLGEGVTDANGAFTLKPGQYAVFYVPDDTSWYVYEGINPGYPLDEVTAKSDVADNASIVDETNGVVQNEHSVYVTHTIILTLTDADDGSAIEGGKFTLYKDGDVYESGLTTDKNGQIVVSGLTDGEYYFEQTEAPSGFAIPDNPNSDSVVIGSELTKSETYEVEMADPELETYNVKYAVSVWGIYQDEDEYGNKLGLTFGPATGESYVSKYVSRETVIESGGTHDSEHCIHDMSWSQIIEQSKNDASVFQDCLENGCTKAVCLNLNDTLLGTDYSGTMDNGDGTNYLYNSISSEYRRWNGTSSSYTNSGGWPQSKIRANLNGADEYTSSDENKAGTTYVCDESNCLFSCFPKELQEGVVAKAVKSDTVYNSQTEANNQTTYDKLWLFSGKEVYGDSGSNNGVIRTYEGEIYQRSEAMGITTSNSSKLKGYYENGTGTDYWWLRSSRTSNSNGVYNVRGNSGDWYNSSAYYTGSIAPGFCLK